MECMECKGIWDVGDGVPGEEFICSDCMDEKYPVRGGD